MPHDLQFDGFLSHSAQDRAVVRPLAERLRTCRAVAARRRRKDGLTVWPVAPKRPRVGGFDEGALKPGDSIPAKIALPSLRSCRETGAGLEPFHLGFQTSDFGLPLPLRLDDVPPAELSFARPNWFHNGPKLAHCCRWN